MTKTAKKNEGSQHEEQFLNQCRAARLPEPKTQLMFHDKRKWRLDFAWPNWMLAVEIHGGTFTQGRHTRGKGMAEDRIKMAEAVLAGWSVMEFTGDQVMNNKAIAFVKRFFDQSLDS